MTWAKLSTLPLLVFAIATLMFWLQPVPEKSAPSPIEPSLQPDPPDFAAINDVGEKKSRFFDFMLDHVRSANEALRQDRVRLLALHASLRQGEPLSGGDRLWLGTLSRNYRVTATSPVEAAQVLLSHVDTIPVSLALAQAANESAWGTSRFARDGNNYYGIWCFSANCGDVPRARDEGKTHEVARFDSVADNVAYYLLTLNRHLAYMELRERRAAIRASGEAPGGLALAPGLINYSERREAYVDEILDMIRLNDLERFDRP